MMFKSAAASALTLGVALTAISAAPTAARAATCSCVAHHPVRHVRPARYPAHYYVPSWRAHRPPETVVYAEPWGYPPPPPVYRPAYRPVAYLPPPPPEYIGGPGYGAVDVAYVGPDPAWRAVRGHRHRAPACHRP